MALLKYLVPKDGLPDPKGSLSQSIPSRAIAAANDEVTKATSGAMNKRGPYRRYSPEERMEIGRYASDHGISVAARYFSRRFQRRVCQSRSKVSIVISHPLKNFRKRSALRKFSAMKF